MLDNYILDVNLCEKDDVNPFVHSSLFNLIIKTYQVMINALNYLFLDNNT